MKRLALLTAGVLAVSVLTGCGGSGSAASSPSSTSDGPKPHEPYKTEKPGQWDSPGVVVANDDGRKLVFDKELPVYDPPITDGGVAQSDWPVAGRLLSIKELIGVFPDATKIGFTPDGPTKLVVTPSLKGDSNSDTATKNTITINITSVGTEDSVLTAYDSKRSSDRTVRTEAGGKPDDDYIYYKDGAFKTQRLRLGFDNEKTYYIVIGNGRTAMQLSMTWDGFYGLSSDDGTSYDDLLRQQIFPLIFQLLAARM